MQKKIQVNQVLHKFSDYGIFLYIFAAIFFYQIVINIIMYILSNYASIERISNLIAGISIGIVIFIFMLMAIIIHSKAHEPATRNFTIFSILWFVFYAILRVISYMMSNNLIRNQITSNPNLSAIFTSIIFVTVIFAPIFQLLVWISLRKFFLDRDDIFPIKTTRHILNYLILLITTIGIVLFVQVTSIVGAISIDHRNILLVINGLTFNQLVYIPLWILLIIGYVLLGYKLSKLKISTDTSIPER